MNKCHNARSGLTEVTDKRQKVVARDMDLVIDVGKQDGGETGDLRFTTIADLHTRHFGFWHACEVGHSSGEFRKYVLVN